MTPPRILYLTFAVSFIDPTRELLVDILGQAGALTLYGPGHSSPRELDEGVAAFADRHGPFDVVVTDEYVLQDFDDPDPRRHRFVNHACRFDRALLGKAVEYRAFLRQCRIPRVLTLMQSDFYNFPSRYIERMDELGDYFITWGGELVLAKAAADPDAARLGGVNAYILDRWNDNYRDFVTAQSHRIISCPQYVAAAEFDDRPLAGRPHPWSVLGADYQARMVARDHLDRAGIACSGRRLPYAFAAANRIKLNLHAHYWSLGLLHWGFRSALRRSRHSFTCGSILRWPIRKFFEIPANGCVLVAEPSEGFGDLGFVHGRTAVACRPDDILDAHAWLSADPARAQAIAAAGRDLVRDHHSVGARARQIGACLRRIRDGAFRGARWRNGDFALLPASDEPAGCRLHPRRKERTLATPTGGA